MPSQARFKNNSASLTGRRIAMGLIGPALLGIYAFAIYNYVAELQNAEARLLQSAQEVGRAIYADLRHRMMVNDRARIRLFAADALRVEGIERVLIIGPKGHVYVDSRPQQPDQTLAVSLPGCIECHFAATVAARPATAPLRFWPGTIRVATAIPHEVSCSSCHLPTGAGLGVVLVDVSLAGSIARARLTLAIWIGLATLGALGAAGIASARLSPERKPFVLTWPGIPQRLRFSLPAWQWPDIARRGGLTVWAASALTAGVVVIAGGGLFATHLENDNAFCAACHTEPETIFYQRTLSPPSDLASLHSAADLACITCHSGSGVLGRSGALLRGARNLAAYAIGGFSQPARSPGPMPDEHCLKCHAPTANDLNPNRHYHYFLPAWQRARPNDTATCAACHLSHEADGRVENGFLNKAATEQVCARCHASAAP